MSIPITKDFHHGLLGPPVPMSRIRAALPLGATLTRSPWNLRLSDWAVRRGRPDRLSANEFVLEFTGRGGYPSN